MRNIVLPHVFSLRGEASKSESAFRDSFANLGELRSITKEGKLNALPSVWNLPNVLWKIIIQCYYNVNILYRLYLLQGLVTVPVMEHNSGITWI